MQRAFTLIELLVVIAIIGLLSAIILASLSTARKKGQLAARQEEVKSLETAIEGYYLDNSHFPQSCAGSADSSVPISTLVTNCLAPTYEAIAPADLVSDSDRYAWDSTHGYGLEILNPVTNTFCMTGENLNPGWWGGPAACGF